MAINGFVGVGGGFLPAVFLAPMIGVKTLLPTLSIMLLISNFSRSWINRSDFHKGAFLREFEPDFFFDDQTGHVNSAALHVPSGHVASGVSNPKA